MDNITGALSDHGHLSGSLSQTSGLSGSLSAPASLSGTLSVPDSYTQPYELPPATTSTLGGVIVGDHREITEEGRLSVTVANDATQQSVVADRNPVMIVE